MQLTGPVFLLIFLPLSLFPVFLFRRRRALVLALLSVLWYLLAFWRSPLACLHIFLLVALVILLSRLPQKRLAAWCGFGIAVAGWAAARILAEYTDLGYTYPAGLTLVSLAAISLLFDRAAGRVRGATVMESCSYLLFYPALMLGPVLRFSDYLALCDSAEPCLARFSHGIRVYMGGYIKRIAIAAPLLRTLEEIFFYDVMQIPVQMLLLALPIAFFLFYFFLTGSTSMARGVALMYGMELEKDHSALFSSVLPPAFAGSMFFSLDTYLCTYVKDPITKKLSGRTGRVLAALAIFLSAVFFFRLRVSMLLFALPLLAFLLVEACRGRPIREPRSLPARSLWALASLVCLSVFALGLVLPEPMSLFALLRGDASSDAYAFYYIYGTLSGANYLPLTLAASVAFVPLSHLYNVLQERLRGRGALTFRITEAVLLFAGFCFALLYFMPQFPVYADKAFSRLYI